MKYVFHMGMLRSVFALVTLALLCSTSLFAAATVSGVVTSQATSNPISGASVVLIKGNNNIVASTTTALDGSYFFTGVNAGKYTVRASATGFQTQSIGVQARNNQVSIVNFSLLSTPGAVSGTVTDAVSTLPISGATVQVFQNSVLVGSTTTNGTGNYTIGGLDPGNSVVIASATGYQTATMGATIQAGLTTTVNFALQLNPGTITGVVTSAATGLPIAGATVELIFNDQVIDSVLTDNSGNYTISGVAPGPYLLRADATPFQDAVEGVIVQAGQTSTVNFSLDSDPGMVTGTVVDANTSLPIAGALVEVLLNNQVLFSDLTDPSGVYEISGVAPGSYVIRASAANHQTAVNNVTVQAGQTSTVNFALQPNPGTVSGTVIDANTTLPIAGAAVELILNNTIIASTLTDASGHYSLPNIAPGTYVMHAHATSYQIGISSATVLSNQTTTVNFSLQNNPSTLQGEITNRLTGNPIPSAFVQVFQNGTLIATDVTDPNGDYEIPLLSAGNYTLVVSANGFYTNSVNFSIAASQTKTLNVSLMPNSPPQNLTGKVENDRFVDQIDRIHHLAWQASQDPTVQFYQIFRNGSLLAIVPASGPLKYNDHNRNKKVTDLYTVNAVNANGDVSSFASVSLR